MCNFRPAKGALRPLSRSQPGWWWVLIGLSLLWLAGCTQDMEDQPRYEPLEASALFPDGQSARPLLAGVVARGAPDVDDPVFSGREDGEWVTTLPVPLTAALLQRGQAQYDIFCSPCHGLAGYGDGMIAQRGFPNPPSFHSHRLRQLPDGHYFDVISNGFGIMFEYGSRVSPADRWAIIAYIRALQLSQNAAIDELPPADVEQIHEAE